MALITSQNYANKREEEDCKDHQDRKLDTLHHLITPLPDDPFHVICGVQSVNLLNYGQLHTFGEDKEQNS